MVAPATGCAGGGGLVSATELLPRRGNDIVKDGQNQVLWSLISHYYWAGCKGPGDSTTTFRCATFRSE